MTQATLDPDSADAVIREIARLKSLIETDPISTEDQRNALLKRLEVEHQSYAAWVRQYASYFEDQRTWTPDLAPTPSDRQLRKAQERAPVIGEPARVVVFADFGGFSHRVSYSKENAPDSQARSDVDSMITAGIYDFMREWASEFHRNAWDDAMRGKHGSMLWVPFDIQGISIARAIKLCVGEAARVFYLKPSEDPFCRFEYAREMLVDGAVLSNEYMRLATTLDA